MVAQRFICLLAIALAVASCAPESSASDGPSLTTITGTWRLVGGAVLPVEEGIIQLSFDGASVTGDVYCNTITGLASVDSNELNISDVQVTTEQCGPLLDVSASAFVQTFISVNGASISGAGSSGATDQLTLQSELGDLIFAAEG